MNEASTTTNATAIRVRWSVVRRRSFYALILLAAWNAVLRPSVDVPVTPYYLLVPLVFAWLLAHDQQFRRWIGWFALIAAYGLTVGLIYGVPPAMQFAQLLKYLQLLALLGMLSWLHRNVPGSQRTLIHIILWLVVMVFTIAAVQVLTGFEFPTVVNEESSLWLNTYFFTPNDLALFLGAVSALLLSSGKPRIVKLLGVLLISLLNLHNDAKAVLLATALMFGMSVLLGVCERLRVRPIAAVAAFVVGVPMLVGALAQDTFGAGETEFDFLQLFLDPIERIVELEPYDLGGSIFDRTDALIYSVKALISMAWMGLGPGGSVHTLAQPNFELLTAKSLHNALAELLVDFGPVMLVTMGLLLLPVVKSLWRLRMSPREHGRLLLVAAAPLLSVSQSSGYVSNYAFWLVAYVAWCRPHAARASPVATERSAKLSASILK